MTELYRYQRKGVRKIDQFDGRVLLADDMGLGKTIQALWWGKHYLPADSTIVVICPASVKFQWQREAALHVNMRSEVLSGLIPPHGQLPPGKMFIINYDILNGRQEQSNSWLHLLMDLNPDLVIVDECHYIKGMNTKRTKAVRLLCHYAPHVIMLSGTPLTNRPIELFPALNIICPDESPSYGRYAWRYCGPRRTPWGMEFKGATNLDELHDRLNETCMIRRKKCDVLKDLPAKTRTVIPLELPPGAKKEYLKAEREFIQWLAKLSPAKARSAERAEYLVKRGYLKRLAAALKLPLVIKWLEDFLQETDEKLIFFGVHKLFLKPVYEHFKKCSVFVDGSVTGRKRQRQFDAFSQQKARRLLVGNIQAAGTGWNGQAANHVAFGELDWVPGIDTQAEDRTHRIGQLNPVTCHYLVSEGTIEEYLCMILQEKQKVLTNVLDGTQDVELDIMLKLEEKLMSKYGRKAVNGKEA